MTRKKPSKREQVDAAVSWALASPYTAEIVREILMHRCWPEFHICRCRLEVVEGGGSKVWHRCREHQKEYERRTMDPPRSCACDVVPKYTRWKAARMRGRIEPDDDGIKISPAGLDSCRQAHICKAPTPAYLEWRR